jgi:hypothetical protein
MSKHNPEQNQGRRFNKRGREGNPISLAPLTFDEAVRKMLATEPPKRETKDAKPQKKSAKK